MLSMNDAMNLAPPATRPPGISPAPRARVPLDALKGLAQSRTISLPPPIWDLLARDARRRGLATSALVRMVLLNFYAGDDDPTLNMPDSLREVL